MSDPQDPRRPPIPEQIHRNEASQSEVDERLADYAASDRAEREEHDASPHRIASLLAALVTMQGQQLDLQTEQTRLLQAILQAVSPQGA
jgi:hypothetical protein